MSRTSARGYEARMTRATAVLAVLTDEPTSTDELYERVGYPTLTRVGLVAYEAFRAELARLAAAGLADSARADDGATLWSRRPAAAEPGAGGPGPPAA
jgi:hypothetical protein